MLKSPTSWNLETTVSKTKSLAAQLMCKHGGGIIYSRIIKEKTGKELENDYNRNSQKQNTRKSRWSSFKYAKHNQTIPKSCNERRGTLLNAKTE